jgi:hypothetical protein
MKNFVYILFLITFTFTDIKYSVIENVQAKSEIFLDNNFKFKEFENDKRILKIINNEGKDKGNTYYLFLY